MVSSSNNARPMTSSDGTTSRNSRPEAATASQMATIATMMAMRSSVTGLDARSSHWRARQAAGLSHRSIRSVAMKKITLTRMTKQIAA